MKSRSLWLRKAMIILLAGAGVVLLWSGQNLKVASAHPAFEEMATATPHALTSENQAVPANPANSPHTSGDCLGCHGKENMTGKFANGDAITLYINPVVHKGSFHNQQGMSCKICHDDQKDFPHKGSSTQTCSVCHWQISGGATQPDELAFDIPFDDKRAMSLSINNACKKCHANQFDEVKDSGHTRILQEGNRYAPVCVDCHNAHDITPVDRQAIALICSKCHLAEYTAYRGSVHGAALEKDSNTDVPTCENCHGAHKVTGPRETEFRGTVAAEICGKCHANKDLMTKYGLSTDVLSTYMDDVHGKTDLFGRLDNQNIIRAGCYDCHGIHNILSPQNPYSRVYPDNLQKTCQRCHKDANITFPTTWLSHKKPSLSTLPGLYLANLTSFGVVAIILAAVVIFILMDIRRRVVSKITIQSKKKE